ncbi:DUF5330 domain-containing protein [Hansschlegelia beijingensis]|uniref:DUF5330 domain-containing protein n=1 Tax=Hansschlegelia beijingensis TaxID=1133344 RepID=A0A7W6GDJ8_9HYPH|nr:DUF5330 domain-containing protein [Hansschlegelia beijingensis]MBB3971896.1 hypothetical protein [Hansschlegelia beijingensis]
MFFLLRIAFWLCVLAVFLPIGGGGGDGPNEKERASIDALSALAAAGATVSDVSGFCERQPDACAVGSQALKLVGERARSGAEMLTGYLSDGASAPKATAASTAGTRDTLTATDRKPAWRGPVPARSA